MRYENGRRKQPPSTGDSTISEADAQNGCALADPALYRDYTEYVYGMPMKLRDPGTIIDPEVTTVTFEGQEVQQVRVTLRCRCGVRHLVFSTSRRAMPRLVGYRFLPR